MTAKRRVTGLLGKDEQTLKRVFTEIHYELEEFLPEAIERLSLENYFVKFRNHDLLEITPDLRDTAAFYCNALNRVRVKVLKIINIDLDYKIDSYAATFYDDNYDTIKYRFINDENGIPAYVIKVNDELAGYYFPEQNILYATDWTHNPRTVEVFTDVWPKLVEECGIKKLEPKQEKKKKLKFPKIEVIVGADPEFELIDMYGNYIRADEILDDEDCEREIGYDGSGCQLELRPFPGTPAQVVKDLRRLVKCFAEYNPSIDVTVTGDVYPLGGHIHIGFKNLKEYQIYNLTASPTINDMITLLDDFIGKKTIDLSGSARGGYKIMGAYERKPWGFEYRTPPAAIFATPEIARICLKIAKNVIETYLNSRQVTYNNPTTKEDYIKVAKLTPNEAEKFFRFINSAPQYPSAVATWTGKKVKIRRRKLRIAFMDDWHEEIKDAVYEGLKDLVYKNRFENVHLILYGLKSERGFVSNIPFANDVTVIPEEEYPETHPELIRIKDNGAVEIHIGLPFEVRMNIEVFEEYEHRLIKAIRKVLNNTVKTIERTKRTMEGEELALAG